MTKVQLIDWVYHYSDSASLGPFNLLVESGEWVALMGASGCGKTTLLKGLGGLLTPTSGRLYLDDCAFNRRMATQWWGKKMGFVLQTHGLLKEWTVMENIILPSYGHQLESEVMPIAMMHITELGLLDVINRPTHALSIGEAQRVALCRALLMNPSILLCDEPTGSLDEIHASMLMEHIQRHRSRHSMTVVMVTHDTYTKYVTKTIHWGDM